MFEVRFLGGVYGFGVCEVLGGMEEFCAGCNIDLGLPVPRGSFERSRMRRV